MSFQAAMVGDIVELLTGEHRGRLGMVTEAFEQHAVVAVMEEGRFGISQAWPFFRDLVIKDRKCRLGTRVQLNGLPGMHARCNGSFGEVILNSGVHPTLMETSVPGRAKVTIGVRLDPVPIPGNRRGRTRSESVLVAPIFITAVGAQEAEEEEVEELVQGEAQQPSLQELMAAVNALAAASETLAGGAAQEAINGLADEATQSSECPPQECPTVDFSRASTAVPEAHHELMPLLEQEGRHGTEEEEASDEPRTLLEQLYAAVAEVKEAAEQLAAHWASEVSSTTEEPSWWDSMAALCCCGLAGRR